MNGPTASLWDAAARLLVELEGDRAHVYDDATGRGIVRGSVVEGNPTIGVGRRVDELGPGLAVSERRLMLANDLQDHLKSLERIVPTFADLTLGRRLALVALVHQVGPAGLGRWRELLAAIAREDFERARAELLDSQAARLTPARFRRLEELWISTALEV